MACTPAAELAGDVRGGARDLGLELVHCPGPKPSFNAVKQRTSNRVQW